MSINNCRFITINNINDPRGNLNFIENGDGTLPFNFNRIYYLHNVPAGAVRGGHAHKNLHQFLICLSGSIEILIDDGTRQRDINLKDPNEGLYLCPMIWRDIRNFSSGSVCAVLASEAFSEDDYIRDYQYFLRATNENN